MIGAFLNALGILLGAIYGLTARLPVSARTQAFFKSALLACTVWYGVRLVYVGLPGTFLDAVKQLLIAVLALVVGRLLGKMLQLQKISNRLGRHASGLITAAQKGSAAARNGGLTAATILFCAAPLGLIGAVADGLTGYFYLLAVKAVMEGLAMVSFARMFRWPVALAALPVFLFLNCLALAVHRFALPWLEAHALVGAVNVAIGLLACIMSLVILEIRRVELANYLPSLALAPLLTWWLL